MIKNKSSLLKPVLNKQYPMIDYGQGTYLYTKDGRKILDGCSGAIVANIGHGIEEIARVAYEQTKKVSFTYRTQFTSDSAEKLAEKLVSKAKGMGYAFFTNSGSEATELACRLAIQHWQEKGQPFKQKILSRKISYHGTTLGALSLSGNFPRRSRYNFMLNDYPSIPAPYCLKCPFSLEPNSCGMKCATELEQVIKEMDSGSIAAFIAEPLVGASGAVITPPPGYYEIIREICDRHEVLFITDEVMTGLGRTGEWFAMNHWGVEPDIIALGKGVSAGYTPIAAILVTEKVMDPIFHGSGINVFGHTYSGNPLSTKISLAVLEYMEKNRVLENVQNLGPLLMDNLKNLKKKYPIISDVRGKGFLIGLELNTNLYDNKNLANDLVETSFKEGLLVYPSIGISNSTDGQAIIIAPPLTTTQTELNHLLDLLEISIQKLLKTYEEEIYEFQLES